MPDSSRPITGLGVAGRLLYEATKDGIRSTAEQLRRNGGLPPFDAPREKERDLERVAILHELLDRPAADAVDPATWSDLDMDGMFLHVDRCTSCIGEQTLYDILRTTTAGPADLGERDRLAEAFAWPHCSSGRNLHSADSWQSSPSTSSSNTDTIPASLMSYDRLRC